MPSQGVCYGWDIKSAFPGGVPAHVVGDAALAIASAPPAGAGSSSSSKDLYPRLVRRGVEVQTITKGGVRMKGLFTKDHLPVCTLVGFFLGDWYSDATYQELLEAEQLEVALAESKAAGPSALPPAAGVAPAPGAQGWEWQDEARGGAWVRFDRATCAELDEAARRGRASARAAAHA